MRRGSDHNFCRLIGSVVVAERRTTREIDELNVAYDTKAGDSYCSLSPAYPVIPCIGKHWLVRRAA
jgi:hypothetical protein